MLFICHWQYWFIRVPYLLQNHSRIFSSYCLAHFEILPQKIPYFGFLIQSLHYKKSSRLVQLWKLFSLQMAQKQAEVFKKVKEWNSFVWTIWRRRSIKSWTIWYQDLFCYNKGKNLTLNNLEKPLADQNSCSNGFRA